jgi:integrase
VPTTEAMSLAPEQVTLLLDAADHSPSPWLGTWTVLAAATGARNGELCGLEWADLNLGASTVRFRQALTIIDPAVLPAADPRSSGRRTELAVGPVKSTASSAILSLPPFAVQALRHHRRQQADCAWPWGSPPPCRCAGWNPVARSTRSSWTWCSAPSGVPQSVPTTPAAPSPA